MLNRPTVSSLFMTCCLKAFVSMTKPIFMNHVYWLSLTNLKVTKIDSPQRKAAKSEIGINWDIKILNSMTSFIDATSSHRMRRDNKPQSEIFFS